MLGIRLCRGSWGDEGAGLGWVGVDWFFWAVVGWLGGRVG